MKNFDKVNFPVLIIKSEKDAIAKFVPRLYSSPNVEVLDKTDERVNNLFREHLYHMVHPKKTVKIIEDFINKKK